MIGMMTTMMRLRTSRRIWVSSFMATAPRRVKLMSIAPLGGAALRSQRHEHIFETRTNLFDFANSGVEFGKVFFDVWYGGIGLRNHQMQGVTKDRSIQYAGDGLQGLHGAAKRVTFDQQQLTFHRLLL